MSTTNPKPGSPQPGAGKQWPADAADLSKPDDSGGGGGVDPAALKRGHEQDLFAVKPILSIPIAVVVTFVIAFGVAWGVFSFYMSPSRLADPSANPMAAKRNEAPLNDRLARIDRTGRLPGEKNEVDNARLEPLKMFDHDGQATTRIPLAGNSPEYHPEDIVPSPEKWPQLFQGAKHVPLDKAMADLGANKELRGKVLPTRKNPVPADGGDRVSASSAGRKPIPADPHAGHDHGPKKKDDHAPAPKPAGEPEKK